MEFSNSHWQKVSNSPDHTRGRFVVLHHTGHGQPHWDLMLECERALATWKLYQHPRLLPRQALEIFQLADHRPAYLDYEGSISGGRGEVKRVDCGTYIRQQTGNDAWQVQLQGSSLRGTFTLQRIQDKQWRISPIPSPTIRAVQPDGASFFPLNEGVNEMNPPVLDYTPVIGLEIHLQLATQTKLFCGCEVVFGAPPNSRVCPVCLGLPGALPVINHRAIELAILTSVALNCRIAGTTRWDRKSYFYPDLPKNYQISQYDHPIGQNGWFQYSASGKNHRVRIRRAHLEEDAGKNLHEHPKFTQIDLNRTGTPLLEIVTEPDLHCAEDAYQFCMELHHLASHLGVSEASMQKGQMRFEPNVNVIIQTGQQEIATPICEIKNLNSFRSLRDAIEFEIQRQLQQWQQDPSYTLDRAGRENRGWNEIEGKTVFQRSKEEEHDYRYFPDPDLLPVVIHADWLESLRATLPELPSVRRQRWLDDLKLSQQEVTHIMSDRDTADLFDACITQGARPNTLAKHFMSFWAQLANQNNKTIHALAIESQRIAELANLVDAGTISSTAAAHVAAQMLTTSDSPHNIAQASHLLIVQDRDLLEAMVEEAIAANPQAVEIIRSGGKKAKKSIGFLQGQVMQKSKGSASPTLVREILHETLNIPLDPN